MQNKISKQKNKFKLKPLKNILIINILEVFLKKVLNNKLLDSFILTTKSIMMKI